MKDSARNEKGEYKKGYIPWMKGKHHSEETKAIISEKGKGTKQSKRTIAKRIQSRKGYRHSEETRRKIGEANKKRKGKNHPRWKGGYSNCGEYILIYKPEHPHAINNKYVFEHRLMVEKALGRYLKKSDLVHHINGDKKDNRNCNLLVCTRSYHKWLHGKMADLYIKEHFRRL